MRKLKGGYPLCIFIISISFNSYCQTQTLPYDYQIDLRFDSTNFSFTGDLTLSWLNESLKEVDEFPFLFYMDKSNPLIYDATIDNNSCKIKYTTS
ncbi:MAG: hypothetical protein Q8933_17155 [Bacteroidota bacterium]|nr:hypothetical protein [Bacteroidota bacterium]